MNQKILYIYALGHVADVIWCIAYQAKPFCTKFSSIKLGDNMLHKYMYCSEPVPSIASGNTENKTDYDTIAKTKDLLTLIL